jgi:Primase C terminal 1 (PriCT-1)
MHESGNRYAWHHDPAAEPLAPEPAWWAASCTRAAVARVAGGEVIASGARNQTLASMAGSMRRAGFDQPAITAALLVTNRMRCRPPLGEDEVHHVAASISRYEPAVLGRPLSAAAGRPV